MNALEFEWKFCEFRGIIRRHLGKEKTRADRTKKWGRVAAWGLFLPMRGCPAIMAIRGSAQSLMPAGAVCSITPWTALLGATQGSTQADVAQAQGLLTEALQVLSTAQAAVQASITSAEGYAARL